MRVAQNVGRELLADDALVVVKTVLQRAVQAQWRLFAGLSEHISAAKHDISATQS